MKTSDFMKKDLPPTYSQKRKTKTNLITSINE